MEHSKLTYLTSCLSYAISGSLVIGDWLHWLNANAAACGVILGFLTYLTNTALTWHFKSKEHKAALAGRINRREK